jgi:hypothetical protein
VAELERGRVGCGAGVGAGCAPGGAASGAAPRRCIGQCALVQLPGGPEGVGGGVQALEEGVRDDEQDRLLECLVPLLSPAFISRPGPVMHAVPRGARRGACLRPYP